MRMLIVGAALLVVGSAAGAIADGHSAKVGDLTIEEAKSRPTIPNRPAAIYLTIRNDGTTDSTLVSASSPLFSAMELHESKMTDGVMSMAAVGDITIPAGGMVMLEPGGLHLMGFGSAEPLKKGTKFPVTLRFADGSEATVMAQVGRVDGGGHGHGDHSGHGGHSGHGNHSGHGTTN